MTNTIELAPAGERLEPGAAKPPDQAKKARLLRKAIALAREAGAREAGARESGARESGDPATAEQVIQPILSACAASRPRRAQPADLCGAALSLWRFAARRRPAGQGSRLQPRAGSDGWTSPHTIVEIVNDDMPFLVDLVTAAINAGDGVVHLVIHPVVAWRAIRAAGCVDRARRPGPRSGPGRANLWMQIEITREPDPATSPG